MSEAPPLPTDVATSIRSSSRRAFALFRRTPALWIVPALPLLLVGALFPSSWQTELRPGFSHARAFVPGKVALLWAGLGAAVYWGTLLADRFGLMGGASSLRFPNGVSEMDRTIVQLVCLALALFVTYAAPVWLLLR